jgi:hypothetical protein
MARQLVRAAGDDRHTLPSKECLLVYVRRWERGDVGVSERYTLLYCEAFGITPEQFGPGSDGDGGQAGAAGGDERGVVETGGAAPAAGSEASGPVGWRGVTMLAGMLRDIRDCLWEDTKICQVRAGQAGGDPIRAAWCRGQALAYTAAAEQIDAALASGTLLGRAGAELPSR